MKRFSPLFPLLLGFQVLSCLGQSSNPSGIFPGPIPPAPSPPPLPAPFFTARLNGVSAIPANNSPLSATAGAGVASPFDWPPYAWWIYVYVDFPFSQITNHPDIYPEVASVQNQDGTFVTDLGCPPTDPCPFMLFPPEPPIGPPFCIGCFYPPIVMLPPTYVSGLLAATAEQLQELEAGHWYVNVTFADTNGTSLPHYTIRGQLLLDSDQDGVPDEQDECSNTPPGALVDAHGCSIEQLCPCEAPWKNHGEYLKCLRTVTEHFERSGLITEAQEHAIQKEARASKCGDRRRPGRHEHDDDERE